MKHLQKIIHMISDNKSKLNRYLDLHPRIFKTILINLILVIALSVLVFASAMIISDGSIDLSIQLPGWKMLASVFSNQEIIQVTEEFGALTIVIPTVVSWIFWGLTIGLILAIGMLIIVCTVKTVSKRIIKLLDAYVGGLGIFMVLVLIFLIGNFGITALNLYGVEEPFYQVFTVGPSYLIVIVLTVFAGALAIFLKETVVHHVRRNMAMYVLLFIPAILMFVFNLYPIFLQTVLSLKDYNISDGVFGSQWVWFDNFKKIFTDPSMLKIVGNTMFISLCRMVVSIIPPIILAIFLFDMGKEKLRSKIQTIIYIPHFFSWVVIYGIAYAFINPEGLINNLIVSFGGDAIKILTSESKFIPLLLFTDLWKELGWGTILYLAALTNVDPSLYEAASIDGAGPFKKLINITLPGIAPTIVFVSVMAVGNILKGAGFEQIMLFGSENMESAQVIDTWVIWKGLNGLEYGLGAAVSFFQSAIGLILVLTCNKLSKKLVGIGLF